MNQETTAFQTRIQQLFQIAKRKTGISQEEYAKRFGATRAAFRGWLRGTGTPNPAQLVELAHAENVSVEWLTGQTDDMLPKMQELSIRQAMKDPNFIIYAKVRMAAIQAAAEKMIADQAADTKGILDNFEQLSEEKQIEILEHGFSKVIKSGERYELIALPSIEERELEKKFSALPLEKRQRTWENIMRRMEHFHSVK